MAHRMGFFIALIVTVALSVVGSEGGRTLANLQEEDKSPALSYWQRVFPAKSIPDALKELISPLSSEHISQMLQLIRHQQNALGTHGICHKGSLHCNPSTFGYDNLANEKIKTDSRARLLSTGAVCRKGDLDCKPGVAVTPDIIGYDHYGKRATKEQVKANPTPEFPGTNALCEKGKVDCKPTARVTPNIFGLCR